MKYAYFAAKDDELFLVVQSLKSIIELNPDLTNELDPYLIKLETRLKDQHSDRETKFSQDYIQKRKQETIPDYSQILQLGMTPKEVKKIHDQTGKDFSAAEAFESGMVTFIPDDIDWEVEVRIAIEERGSFSPDALTGMEASLRFAGPETLETKIFGRLSAWQNWIFQRPNAAGENGALKLYGTGKVADYNKERV